MYYLSEGDNHPSPHTMLVSINGKPVRDIRMHRLSLKEIVARHKRYQHSTKLLKALAK